MKVDHLSRVGAAGPQQGLARGNLGMGKGLRVEGDIGNLNPPLGGSPALE